MAIRRQDKILEKDIVREICEGLTSRNFFFWRNNNIPVFGRSNDGVKRFRKMSKFTPKGLPDIMIIHKGLTYGIEVKIANKNLSKEQEIIKGKFLENHAVYSRVNSWEEVANLLEGNFVV